jgi:hypothetical protein
MKIAFMSSKGSASKTTYARLVSEYFSKNIKNRIESGYTEIEIKELGFLNTTKPVNIFSVTNHEVTLVRFARKLGKKFMKYQALTLLHLKEDCSIQQ